MKEEVDNSGLWGIIIALFGVVMFLVVMSRMSDRIAEQQISEKTLQIEAFLKEHKRMRKYFK